MRSKGTKARKHEGTKGGRSVRFLPFVPLFLLASGCSRTSSRSATDVDAAQANADYWLSKPATESVTAADFQKLWDSCGDEVRSRFFKIDREDYRTGTLSTLPMVSKQEFEVWRRDAVTMRDVTESSLATVRRSVWFEVRKQPDGTFVAKPKVLVERNASAEHRLTAIYEYHAAFSQERVVGSTELDEGTTLPQDYWYSIGRDAALEHNLAMTIQRRVRG